ncbi:MAG TPA: hypothetical protein PK911_05260 [Candidatus Saccharibacteria bacterium]|nr:hypothetical protein [Candidatus Saccharibacteria bacterium]
MVKYFFSLFAILLAFGCQSKPVVLDDRSQPEMPPGYVQRAMICRGLQGITIEFSVAVPKRFEDEVSTNENFDLRSDQHEDMSVIVAPISEKELLEDWDANIKRSKRVVQSVLYSGGITLVTVKKASSVIPRAIATGRMKSDKFIIQVSYSTGVENKKPIVEKEILDLIENVLLSVRLKKQISP